MKCHNRDIFRLHPFYDYLSEHIKQLCERLKDFDAVTVVDGRYVVAGIATFLHRESFHIRYLPFDGEKNPQTLIFIIEHVAENAPLLVSEAEKLKQVHKKLRTECPEHEKELSVHGLISEIFSLYADKKLPHHLALYISKEMPHFVQRELFEKAKNNPQKLLMLLTDTLTCRKKLIIPSARMDDPGAFYERMIEQILSSKTAREILARKLYEKTKNEMISMIIKNI